MEEQSISTTKIKKNVFRVKRGSPVGKIVRPQIRVAVNEKDKPKLTDKEKLQILWDLHEKKGEI